MNHVDFPLQSTAVRLAPPWQLLARVLSHELRTPLGPIYAYPHFLLAMADGERPPEAAEIRHIAEEVLRSAHRLLTLVEKVELWFELERQAGGEEVARIEPCPLDATTMAVAMERVAADLGRAADLRLDLRSVGVRTVCAARILVVLQQLAENAFKFSEAGSLVHVRLESEGGQAVITVSDRGRGMPEAQRSAVAAFRQFERDRYEQQGVGVGLRIVQLFAHLSGGTMQLDANAGGSGLSVVVRLPLAVSRDWSEATLGCAS
jgi:signal transduction histidine kinase